MIQLMSRYGLFVYLITAEPNTETTITVLPMYVTSFDEPYTLGRSEKIHVVYFFVCTSEALYNFIVFEQCPYWSYAVCRS